MTRNSSLSVKRHTCQRPQLRHRLGAMSATTHRLVDRRRILHWLTLGPAALALALRDQPSLAAAAALEQLAQAPRDLSLHNLHTGESLALRYFDNGQYQPDVLARFNHLLRDHRNDTVARIDPQLFDQLHVLAGSARRAPHYEVICGYRSPATNALLHATSEGVSSHSLHMEGRAIDVRMTGMRCSQLRDCALELGLGGVGYYAKSDFVHLDTGRVRTWRG